MALNGKKYLIDNVPASARTIITEAKKLDSNFGNDGLCCTSDAANILRNYGHIVAENQNADICE